MKQIQGKTEDKQSRERVPEERKLRILAQIDRKKMSMREAEKRFNVYLALQSSVGEELTWQVNP